MVSEPANVLVVLAQQFTIFKIELHSRKIIKTYNAIERRTGI